MSTLVRLLAYDFGHMSTYILQREYDTPFYKLYKEKDLPEADTLYLKAHELLTSSGFEHYEISNYTKKHRSKHNLTYWRGDEPYFAFGMGAANYLDGKRFTRPKSLIKYLEFV